MLKNNLCKIFESYAAFHNLTIEVSYLEKHRSYDYIMTCDEWDDGIGFIGNIDAIAERIIDCIEYRFRKAIESKENLQKIKVIGAKKSETEE